MRPSSSASEPPGLFDEVLAKGAVRAEVADGAWLAALLTAEAVLARAQAALGLIPAEAAAEIAAACRPERYDVAALARDAAGPGNPVLPLVRALRAAVPESVAEYVHRGATTQDILDTAAMLVVRAALGPLLADLRAASAAAARLSMAYRDTAAAGRTLLQHAMPVTFGLKAAGWMVALDGVVARLAEIDRTRLAAQLGGAVGTLDGFGVVGPELVDRFAAELGLAAAVLPWHTDRSRIAELGGALATAAGVVGKVARDIILLAQSEVGEVTEGTGGASTPMPHKHNPVAAVSALACAAQAPGLAATLYAAMAQEHERAAGGWQAEWRPLRALLTSTGSAAAWLHESLAGLAVDPAAIAANLDRLAHAAGLADPAAHLGAAGALVDRALAAHRAEAADRPEASP
jgi:3-carboxy-cis,cis-muconate cycloisomerase